MPYDNIDQTQRKANAKSNYDGPLGDKEGVFTVPELDVVHQGYLTVTATHHEIHEGKTFVAHFDNLCTNTDEQSFICFNTPDSTKRIHMTVNFSATASARVSIAEATSIDVGEGTDLTIYNHDRNSSRTSLLSTVESTPEVGKLTSFNESQASTSNLTETTEIWAIDVGSGSGPFGTGGVASHDNEFILKQNTQYAYIIKSLDINDNLHNILLSWYEK